MLVKTRNPEFKILLGAVGLGVAISAVVVALLFALSWPIMVVGAAGLVGLLPALLMKDATPYWLSLYLFLLPFEAGKRITNLGQTPENVVNTIGLPSSGDIGAKIFPTDLVLLALVIPWLLRVVTRKERIIFPRIGYLLLAYMVWSGLSSFLKSDQLPLSVAQLVHEVKYFVVFLFALNVVSTAKFIRIAMLALVLSLALEAGVAVGLQLLGMDRDKLLESLQLTVVHEYEFIMEGELLAEGREPRAAGTLASAANLALYLQLVFTLPLALAFRALCVKERRFYVLLFCLSVSALLVSASRAGLFGFVTGIATCMCLVYKRGWISRERFIGFIAASALLTVIGAPLLYSFMTVRTETYTHRFSLMREGLLLIAANPVLGVGLNNGTSARLREFAEVTEDTLYPIHNQFIVLAVETGLIGFAFYMAFFVGIAREGIRRSGSENHSIAALSIAIVSGYAAIATQLLGDHFVGNSQHTLVWFYAGLVMAFSRVDVLSAGDSGALSRSNRSVT